MGTIPTLYCPNCAVELEHKSSDPRGEAFEFAEQVHFYQCPNCKALCRVSLVWLLKADLLAKNKEV